MKIPLMSEYGLEHLIIGPHEFGDPHSVTIRLPPYTLAAKKINLPRNLFSAEVQNHIDE